MSLGKTDRHPSVRPSDMRVKKTEDFTLLDDEFRVVLKVGTDRAGTRKMAHVWIGQLRHPVILRKKYRFVSSFGRHVLESRDETLEEVVKYCLSKALETVEKVADNESAIDDLEITIGGDGQ